MKQCIPGQEKCKEFLTSFQIMVLISSMCSPVKAPNSKAPQFSVTCVTFLNPGRGTLIELRPHNQARAPCRSVRPLEVKMSRIASSETPHF